MAGASGSGEEVQTGRTNYEEGRTIFWAQVPPGQPNFNGPAILMLEVAKNASDPDDYVDGDNFVPSNFFHGLIATGYSGGGSPPFSGGTKGVAGVIGRGGRQEGRGIVGLGGGTPSPEPGGTGVGGMGVHGLGGSKGRDDFHLNVDTPPGAGVIGQGGSQSDDDNRARQPHAAGLIGIGGGTGKNKDLLPSHPLKETGGVGVYAQGAEARQSMVQPLDADGNTTSGPDVPSGPLTPGAGVIGRGGVPIPRRGEIAAGVIGLAGDTAIPPISETGDTGVYGRGPVGVHGYGEVGVHGHGETSPRGGPSRGGIFSAEESAPQPQMRLEPLEIEGPGDLKDTALAGDFLVTTRRFEGIDVASLWFCTIGGPPTQAKWTKLA